MRVVLMLLMLVPVAAWAQEPETKSEETHWSLGTDAVPWASAGYSVIGGVEPGWCPGCRAQVEVWGFDFPEFFLEINEANAGEGWRRRANVGVGVYLDYQAELGWHAGLLWSTFHSTLTREGASADLVSMEVLGRLGWRFIIWEGLYLDPWVAAGPLWTMQEAPVVAGEQFSEANIQILATLHLGWRF